MDNKTLRSVLKRIKHISNCQMLYCYGIIFSRKVYQCPYRGTCMAITSKLDKTEKVGITLPGSILKRVDKVRRDIPRSMFIRRALEQFLREGK